MFQLRRLVFSFIFLIIVLSNASGQKSMLSVVNDSLKIAHIFEPTDHVFIEYVGYNNQSQTVKGTIHSVDSLRVYITPNAFNSDSIFTVSIDDISGIRRVRLSVELFKSLVVLASSLSSLHYLNSVEASQLLAITGSATIALLTKKGTDYVFPSSKSKFRSSDGWRFTFLSF